MKTKKPLYKTTIVIWSTYDTANIAFDDLVNAARNGDGYCSKQESICVFEPENDPDFTETKLFDEPEEKDA